MLRSIDQEKCIGCGSCFKTCGFDVFRLETKRPRKRALSGGLSRRHRHPFLCPSAPAGQDGGSR